MEAVRPDTIDIAERIIAAIMEHRLPPGAKLAEENLLRHLG